jgi:hypothetical protein
MNYDIKLLGKNELYPGVSNKIYHIMRVDNKNKIEYMINHFKKFKDHQLKNKKEKHYLSIDLEYNKVSKEKRDVALFQINLECDDINAYIYVFYPPELNKNQEKELIDFLATEEFIKILHGSESLDVPYLFNQLIKEKSKIEKFCTNYYDTKYLCDYNIAVNKEKYSCSIYHLLEKHKVITKEKVIELEKIEERMGPIYLIYIDIHKMSNDVFLYSLYDVIFLPSLLKKLVSYGYPYSSLIPEITCNVLEWKRAINKDFQDMVLFLGQANNWFIIDKTKVSISNFYDLYYIYLNDSNSYIKNLRQINYFKSYVDSLFKLVIYNLLVKKFKVYSSSDKIVKSDIFNQYMKILDDIPEYGKILKELSILIESDLKKIDTKTI